MAEIRQIQLRRATAAAWTTNDPTLAQGEIGVETDTLKAKIGDGIQPWSVLSYFDPAGLDLTKVDGTPGVKVYRALWTQTGTDTPTAVVLENTLEGTLTIERGAAGVYKLHSSGSDFADETKVYFQIAAARSNDPTVNGIILAAHWHDANYVFFEAYDIAGALADWDLVEGKVSIEVLVYP